MTEDELFKALGLLGIDRDSHRALALLPLVQVAWADGRIQASERKIILRVAQENGYLDGDAQRLLEDWLTNRPKDVYFDRARTLLIAVVRHDGTTPDEKLGVDALTDLVDLCEEIAHAAGGLFGLFPVDVRERQAIREIVDAIGLPPEATLNLDSWKDLRSS